MKKVPLPRGFRVAGVHAGLKKNGEPDVGLIHSMAPCVAAAVFTKNQVQAAPVVVSKAHVEAGGGIHGIVLNSGCANAVTGERGFRDAVAMCDQAAELTGSPGAPSFLVMSTGIIGQPLPMEKLLPGLQAAASALTDADGLAFARSMMTTDSSEKTASLDTGGAVFTGFAKGAGMIHPDMATLLAVVITDAVATQEHLRPLLREIVDETFNAISIDGDTSTNDMVVVLANGASGVELRTEEWLENLRSVCQPLAKAIVSDGEGVKHLVELSVEGARTHEEAKRIAKTISTSLLVKTAIFGGDPNWGRLLAAAGRSGVAIDVSSCSLAICGVPLLSLGNPLAFDKGEVSRRMAAKEWSCKLVVGSGDGRARVWFSDLSHDYVRINSEYTT